MAELRLPVMKYIMLNSVQQMFRERLPRERRYAALLGMRTENVVITIIM